MTVRTGTTNETWVIERHDGDDHGGCSLTEMEHYGQRGTGFIWCAEHGEVAGTITSPSKGD